MSEQDKPLRSKKKTRIAIVCVAAVILVLVFCVFVIPGMVAGILKGRMEKVGFRDVSVDVDAVGPFYAGFDKLSFSSGAFNMDEGRVESSYVPTDLLSGSRIDALTLDSARMRLDLNEIMSAPAGEASAHGVFELPFMLAPAMDMLPVSSVMIRDARLGISAGEHVHDVRIDALVRQPSAGVRSATVSASADNGDQLLLTVEGQGGKDVINAEGSVDLFGWLLDCGKKSGFAIGEDVSMQAAPLVFQVLLEQMGQEPGKWVGIVSQPWFQYEQGRFIIAAEDLRAGVTGNAEGLEKAAAEGDLIVKSGDVTVGPFHPSFSATDIRSIQLQAQDVPVGSVSGYMLLEYIKGTAFLPEGGGDYSIRGSFKPGWFPRELNMAVSAPASLDGVFVDIALPRSEIEPVQFPDGWLPRMMDGLTIGGAIDADLFISAGGLTAGGFSASGRISADNAFARVPDPRFPVSLEGIMVRNARISSIASGFALELPEGIKAASADVGMLRLDDVQVWPCHMSYPGRVGLGSITAMLYGGRLIMGEIRGNLDLNGTFKPVSPIDMTCTGLDFAALGAAFGLAEGVSGRGDLSMSLRPTEDGSFDSALTLRSDGVSLSIPDTFSISTALMDLSFGSSREAEVGTVLRLELVRALPIRSMSVGDFVLSGNMTLKGGAKVEYSSILACLAGVCAFRPDADFEFDVRSTSLSSASTGLSVDGIEAGVKAAMDKDSFVVVADSVKAASLAIGKVKASGLDFSLSFDAESGLSVKAAKASFFGGSITLTNFHSSNDGAISFSAQLEDVLAAQVVELFSAFKGSISGRIDGTLSMKWQNGELVVYPSSISLDRSVPARLGMENAEELVQSMGQMDDMVRRRTENTLRNMVIKEFSLETKADSEKPVFIRLVGEGADSDSLPVDISLTLKGDIEQSLMEAFGNRFKVRFAITQPLAE